MPTLYPPIRTRQNSLDAPDRLIGNGIGFERTRRITGYLVGTLDRFNNAKRAEERDRVKHDMHKEASQ